MTILAEQGIDKVIVSLCTDFAWRQTFVAKKMRRFEQNLGEKRVLLGSVEKKNNLKVAYQKLNLEEKAFISSTQFNRRQLLSRQNKLRQLQKQSVKRRNVETQQSRTSLPVLPKVNENTIRSYSSNLTLPYSRRGPREGKHVSSLFGKEDRASPIKFDNSQSNTEGKLINFKDESPEKRNEMKTVSKTKLAKVGADLKSKPVGDSGLHVGDIVAYSDSVYEKEKPTKGGLVEDRDNRAGKGISKFTNENKNVEFGKQIVWKDDPDSSSESISVIATYQESEDTNKQIFPSNGGVLTSVDHSRQRSPRVVKTSLKESAVNGDESTLVSITDEWLKSTSDPTTDTVLTNSPINELKSESSFITKSLKHSSETGDPNVLITFEETNDTKNFKFDSAQHIEDQTESSPSPSLVSRTPSWNGTQALPELGRIRRGSFCDVKTFTSGKVLDLLSSCEVPEKKPNRQFLDVDHENLKYCRYLRNVTPEHAGGEAEIPLKYRPSKNIVIGHTKMMPLQ